MGKKLLRQMVPALQKMKWPRIQATSEQGRQTYDMGLDKVDMFRDDAKVLASALRTFQAGDSEPYAFAGVAYTLLAAAKEENGRYHPEGLQLSLSWLEKAQASEPDVVSINFIESLIYIYEDRLEDARLILDYLGQQDPANYHLLVSEMLYWIRRGEITQVEAAFQAASEASVTVPQRLRLRSKLAQFYLQEGMLDKAQASFKEAIHFDQKNYAMWHDLSRVYFQQENMEEAAKANKQALKIKPDFAEAMAMENQIKKAMGSGVLGRLFGRRSG